MLTGQASSLARARSITRGHFSTLVVGACALLIAYALKAGYSRANADDLLWILAPSSWLATHLGGVELRYEAGAGFISHAERLVVGPACAGVNFLIICFLALYFSFAHAFASRAPSKQSVVAVVARLRWLLVGLALAYAATILTNGLRIVLSARLYRADIYGTFLTPGRVHRLAGTVIYYASLLAVVLTVAALAGARTPRVTPLLAYLGVSLGVPLVGRTFAARATFPEHALWVLGVALVLTALVALPSVVRNRVQWRT